VAERVLSEEGLAVACAGSRLFRVFLVAAVFLIGLILFVDILFVVLVVLAVLAVENQIEIERIFAMRVDHVLLPIAAREIDRVRVIQIVANLDPEVPIVAAVAERVRVDDTAVNGFDVNFVRHERQSSIGAGEVEGV
jgi:hypothetical protein